MADVLIDVPMMTANSAASRLTHAKPVQREPVFPPYVPRYTTYHSPSNDLTTSSHSSAFSSPPQASTPTLSDQNSPSSGSSSSPRRPSSMLPSSFPVPQPTTQRQRRDPFYGASEPAMRRQTPSPRPSSLRSSKFTNDDSDEEGDTASTNLSLLLRGGSPVPHSPKPSASGGTNNLAVSLVPPTRPSSAYSTRVSSPLARSAILDEQDGLGTQPQIDHALGGVDDTGLSAKLRASLISLTSRHEQFPGAAKPGRSLSHSNSYVNLSKPMTPDQILDAAGRRLASHSSSRSSSTSSLAQRAVPISTPSSLAGHAARPKRTPSISRDPSANWLSAAPEPGSTMSGAPIFSRRVVGAAGVVMPLSPNEFGEHKRTRARSDPKTRGSTTQTTDAARAMASRVAVKGATHESGRGKGGREKPRNAKRPSTAGADGIDGVQGSHHQRSASSASSLLGRFWSRSTSGKPATEEHLPEVPNNKTAQRRTSVRPSTANAALEHVDVSSKRAKSFEVISRSRPTSYSNDPLMPPSFSVRAPAPAMPAIPETARAALPRAMSEPSIRARQHTQHEPPPPLPALTVPLASMSSSYAVSPLPSPSATPLSPSSSGSGLLSSFSMTSFDGLSGSTSTGSSSGVGSPNTEDAASNTSSTATSVSSTVSVGRPPLKNMIDVYHQTDMAPSTTRVGADADGEGMRETRFRDDNMTVIEDTSDDAFVGMAITTPDDVVAGYQVSQVIPGATPSSIAPEDVPQVSHREPSRAVSSMSSNKLPTGDPPAPHMSTNSSMSFSVSSRRRVSGERFVVLSRGPQARKSLDYLGVDVGINGDAGVNDNSLTSHGRLSRNNNLKATPREAVPYPALDADPFASATSTRAPRHAVFDSRPDSESPLPFTRSHSAGALATLGTKTTKSKNVPIPHSPSKLDLGMTTKTPLAVVSSSSLPPLLPRTAPVPATAMVSPNGRSKSTSFRDTAARLRKIFFASSRSAGVES